MKATLTGLPEDSKVEIRSPSFNSEKVCKMLEGFGTYKKEAEFITQFTKSLPDYNYDLVYCITDTLTPV